MKGELGVQGGTMFMGLIWVVFAKLPSVSHWLMSSIQSRL